MLGSKKVRTAARIGTPLLLMLVVMGVGAAGVVGAARARVNSIGRVGGLDGVLSPLGEDPDGSNAKLDKNNLDQQDPLLTEAKQYSASNYLIVGSDSRERAKDYDFDQYIGDEGDVGGQRADVIMVLRQEANGPASLLSIPRDLWTKIPGYKPNRINAAYNYGPEVLTKTITQELGIPINHYVEVDFFAFKDLVNSVGGVEMCLGRPARDTHTGLALNAGCQILDGDQALKYARSRYYQEADGDEWVSDPTGDRGRVLRQQQFIRTAVTEILNQLQESPFAGNKMLKAVTGSVRLDPNTDPLRAARALRSATSEGLTTYVLPTYDTRVGDAAVLKLSDGAQEVLDYFAGTGPAPANQATGTMGSDGKVVSGISPGKQPAGGSSGSTTTSPSTTDSERRSTTTGSE